MRTSLRQTVKRLGWAVVAIPFGAGAGALCGLLPAAILASLFGGTDPVTGTRYTLAAGSVVPCLVVGVIIGAVYMSVQWFRQQGPSR